MDSTVLGFIGIAVGIFLGLIAIAVGVVWGLRGFRTEITNELSPIREKVIIIQQTVQNVWDVARRSSIFQTPATIERSLQNLGKIKITAEPQGEETNYFVEAEKSIVLDSRLITSLSEGSGLNAKEREMFNGKLIQISGLLPHQVKMTVPSSAPKVCTEYMRFFLNWLDTVYYESLPIVQEFEEPI